MTAELAESLVAVTLASSVATLLVFALRKPLRALAGPRAAYALWALVPALTIAVLLPAPEQALVYAAGSLPSQLGTAFKIDVVAPASDPAWTLSAVLAIWAFGAAAMLVTLVRRQRAFTRSFGELTPVGEGVYRSDTISAPMLMGFLNPRIIVPRDFDARYSADERELVLAHERAHARRGDVAVNALAALALCAAWFNPLAYLALASLRMDQELACDAAVLARRADARRRYADALLKTQLATEAAWRAPIGCAWQSNHPLTERISMLKKPAPGLVRRVCGVTLIAALTGAASYATWAGQPAGSNDSQILVDMKIRISNSQTNEVRSFATQYLVRSGGPIKDAKGRSLDVSCTPYLSGDASKSSKMNSLNKSLGIAIRPGQIFLDCEIRRDGQVVESPMVIVGDGKWAAIESSERGGPRVFKIEVRPSTAPEDIAKARNVEDAGE
jgi:beta-lactamase regulating signal transducer with metallopeptidase domain